jgi:hypothetical protein
MQVIKSRGVAYWIERGGVCLTGIPASWLIESLVSVQVGARRALVVELKFAAVGLASR